MLLTPPDVISQTLLAVPMWMLFELGVFFARRMETQDTATQDNESADSTAADTSAASSTGRRGDDENLDKDSEQSG
jgi:sec-independent protein translocase protein TatC